MKILVVEDEIKTTAFLRKGLTESGFAVDVCRHGEEGLHRAQSGDYDLMILDVMLPQRDGWSILKDLRRAGNRLPTIFLTARDAVQDRVKGLEFGADDYMVKPFAFVELLARVRSLIRRQQSDRTAVVTYEDVRVDLATHRAERGGRRLDLTAKEQALLVLFLRHPGEVMTRTRIYETVWGDRYDGLSNTLEVHVMELRRKLEAHGGRLIHTLRGRGYVFGEGGPAAPAESSKN